jgi:hypothetical protein
MKNPAAVALGTLGGKVKSEAKAKTSAANGTKGGRPPKNLKCEICGQMKPRSEITFCKYSITDAGQTCNTCLEELSDAAHKHHMGEDA